MNTKKMLDTFFHPQDQDAFARSQGWVDAEQMIYYEDMAHQEECAMTDREAQAFVEREEAIAAGQVGYLAPPPVEILILQSDRPAGLVHELDKVDSREVYTDSEDCPSDGDMEHDNWQDLAGVY